MTREAELPGSINRDVREIHVKLRIQFELGQKSHERHFGGIIEALSARGHEVIRTTSCGNTPGLVERDVSRGDHRSLMAFSAHVRDDAWGPTSYLIRTGRDFLRYCLPEHEKSMIIRDRIRNMLEAGLADVESTRVDGLACMFEDLAPDESRVWALDGILEALERQIPPHPAVVDHLRTIGPDLLCITPLVITQYGQTELVKAARALCIPTVFMVGSWDNLTTKGAVHEATDYTFVWNQIQRDEASRFHRLAPESVRLVGAARFDEFWERNVEVDRADYCRSYRLDPARPIITYLGSSNLISGDERGFVRRWVSALRESADPHVADANILLRPHPKFAKGWEECFRGEPRVAVCLSQAPTVKALNNDKDLFHCLAHSRIVVGANTSAELEAGIVGKAVFTVKDSELATGQEGTIHFGYLAGSLATIADTLEEHLAQLSAELRGPENLRRNDEFLTMFLRPGGLQRPARLVTADALESLPSAPGKGGTIEPPKTSGEEQSGIRRLVQLIQRHRA